MNGCVFTLPALPYSQDALEPHVSARTMGLHYGTHHQSYVDNLNKLVAAAPWAACLTLEQLIVASVAVSDRAALCNNAAQAWNHAFLWNSMKPGGGGRPTGRMMDQINMSFGGFDAFKRAFLAAATDLFGSGWVWLVQDGEVLKILKTANADTPIMHGKTALLTCDVWEHAYYLDYQNRRQDFVQAFLDHLANWEFAAALLK
jgi:Fe-Mn family superoxide dismutase